MAAHCGMAAVGMTTPGNPFVNEPIRGVKFDLTTAALRRDAEAGHVGMLNPVYRDSNAPAIDPEA